MCSMNESYWFLSLFYPIFWDPFSFWSYRWESGSRSTSPTRFSSSLSSWLGVLQMAFTFVSTSNQPHFLHSVLSCPLVQARHRQSSLRLRFKCNMCVCAHACGFRLQKGNVFDNGRHLCCPHKFESLFEGYDLVLISIKLRLRSGYGLGLTILFGCLIS